MKTILSAGHRLFPILALILLVLLCACGEQTEPPTVPDDTTAASAAPDKVIIGGETVYQLVRPENGTGAEIESIQALQKSIRDKTGTELTLSDDWFRTEEEIPACEILVGEVNRAETRAARAELFYEDFIIRLSGDKLVVLGDTPENTARAVDYLLENLITDTGLTLSADFCYHEKSGYSAPNVTVGGISLREYRIAYEDNANLENARLLQRMIGEYCGYSLPVVKVKANTEDSNLIVIGAKKMAKSEFYAYDVVAQNGRLYINAYDSYAYANAFLTVVDTLEKGNNQVELSAMTRHYTLPDRADYLEEPSLLYMRWAAEWETPEWMLDYDLKKEQLFGGKGAEDFFVFAHRADHTYYPENSLEAIISCYYMGVTMVEIDIQITRDGVMVLMHDETLTRMTNAADYIGKPGYPSSTAVSDWTYAQLQELYLKENQGGSSAALTKFKIPTLEEILTFCRGRLFIGPDKSENWQYISTTDVMKDSASNFLFDAMKATGNYESILVSYGKPNGNFFTVDQVLEIQNAIKEACGVTPFILLRCSPSASISNYKTMYAKVPGTFAFQLHGNYNPETNYTKATNENGDKCAFVAWTIGTGDEDNDFVENWRKLADDGIRMLLTNDPMGMVKFAAEYHNP